MKKSFAIAVFALCASMGFALSWNGLFENNTKVSTPDFKNGSFDQSNGIYLSVNAPINKTMRFTGEALYKYNLNLTDNKSTFSNIADVDLFKFSGIWTSGNSNISVDAGRFSISDLAAAFFTQTSDGVNFKYETAKWNVGVYGGYTGLLNSLNVSMSETLAETKDFYSLSVAYIPVGLNFSLTSLFGSTSLGGQAYLFKAVTSEKTDKMYGTVSISGPVSNVGVYSAAVVVGFDNWKDVMLYAKADYSAFISNKGVIGAGVEYASGNQGALKSYKTITAKTVSSTSIPASGVIVPKLSGMFVANNLVATVTEKVVFGMPETQVDFVGVDSAVTVLYNVFSDVQIGCDLMAFVGKDSAANKYSVTAKATLAF